MLQILHLSNVFSFLVEGSRASAGPTRRPGSRESARAFAVRISLRNFWPCKTDLEVSIAAVCLRRPRYMASLCL